MVLAGSSSDQERQLQQDSVRFLRLAHSLYTQLEREQLRQLAANGNAHAQEVLAMEISPQHPDEALELAMRAAAQGRPLAAVVASDILATAKGDPANGDAYLAAFERSHGQDPLVSHYRRTYSALYAANTQKVETQANLPPQNEAQESVGSPVH